MVLWIIPNGQQRFHWTCWQCLTTHWECFEKNVWNGFATHFALATFQIQWNCSSMHFQCISIMWTADIQMKWRCDHRSRDCDLSKCKLSPKNVFRASTRGLCVSTAVPHQLSYEDPYVGSRPIYWVHRMRMKHISIMWTENIQIKWRCDHRSCDCDLCLICDCLNRSHNCDDHIFTSFSMRWKRITTKKHLNAIFVKPAFR